MCPEFIHSANGTTVQTPVCFRVYSFFAEFFCGHLSGVSGSWRILISLRRIAPLADVYHHFAGVKRQAGGFRPVFLIAGNPTLSGIRIRTGA